MRKVKYLDQTRDGTYRLRRVVPPALREILRQTEISISLFTKDPKEAEKRIRRKLDEVDELFERAQNGTHIDYDLRDAYEVVDEWLREEIECWKASSAAWRSPPFAEITDASTSIEAYISKWKIDLVPKAKSYALERAPEEYHRYLHRVELRQALPSMLGLLGPEGARRYREALEDYRAGDDFELNIPEIPVAPAISPPPQVGTHPVSSRPNIKMSVVFKRFMGETQMSISSQNEWTLCWRRLAEFTGDISISDLRPEQIREWLRLYRRCPKSIPNHVRKKTLREIVEFADRNYADYRSVSIATVKKYLTCVKSVLNWAVDQDYISLSPATNVKAPKGNPKGSDERRLPLTIGDLNVTFSSAVYTGCRSARRRHIPGQVIIRDALYWLPILALFTGARLEELGQLYLTDIREESGIPYIDVNADGDKKVKNRHSIRRVPIHPELVRIGFLEYVAGLRQKGELRLFPEFKKDKRDSFTQRFSKTCNGYLRRLGITDPRKVYHSFRHTFKDAARKAKLEKALRDKLQGHAPDDVAEEYGLGWDFPDLYEGICKVQFAGLNLEALVKPKP